MNREYEGNRIWIVWKWDEKKKCSFKVVSFASIITIFGILITTTDDNDYLQN